MPAVTVAGNKSVLVLSAGGFAREALTEVISYCGCDPLWLHEGGEWSKVLAGPPPAAILADEDAPQLRLVTQLYHSVPLILAVQASRARPPIIEQVFLKIPKPVSYADVTFGLERALLFRRIALDCWDDPAFRLSELMGRSRPMRSVYREAAATAGDAASVLIHGERGVGKKALAHFIYGQWGGADLTWALDCSSFHAEELESQVMMELESQVIDGFCSAQRLGRDDMGRTLVLGEVGTLSQSLQSRLLTALQERRGRRRSDRAESSADFRVISISSDPLEKLAGDGLFLPELLAILAERTLFVPPLRERKEDILFLARRLLRRAAQVPGSGGPPLAPAAEPVLLSYNWPGNARELRLVLGRTAALAQGEITPECLGLPQPDAEGLSQARRCLLDEQLWARFEADTPARELPQGTTARDRAGHTST